jgi:hypothetical protein
MLEVDFAVDQGQHALGKCIQGVAIEHREIGRLADFQ